MTTLFLLGLLSGFLLGLSLAIYLGYRISRATKQSAAEIDDAGVEEMAVKLALAIIEEERKIDLQ